MRIVIDIQGAQASNRLRGVGRYTMAVAQAIARLRGEHEVMLALNAAFPESIAPIRQAFETLLPAENIRVWRSPAPVHAADPGHGSRRRIAEYVREAFLASLEPDVVLVSSLFEGLGDDAVASIGLLHAIPTAVVLYDLIPLIHRETYLASNPTVEGWYQGQLGHLRRADLLLAISASSGREAVDYLGFAPECVVNAGTAADPQFQRKELSVQTREAVLARYGLTRPFAMYTGGIDHRKNIEGLIAAFSRLPATVRQEHQLAIVCKADDTAKRHLQDEARRHGLAASDLVLTGYVSEEDLIALYHLCAAFVFPSWHEGFGLPALEAMACGAPVIASNTSSLPEVVELDDALFDPREPADIARKLEQVLTDAGFRARLVAHGLEQARRFSWDATGRRALAALEALHAKNTRRLPSLAANGRRPRLAYVSPLPPEQSGISGYSAELLPELARFYDIDLIVDQAAVEPSWLGQIFPVRDPAWLRSNADRYDRVLYHFGNSAFHKHMFDLLPSVPGAVVMHDFFLSGITWWLEHATRRRGYLAQALYHSHGYASAAQHARQTSIESIIWEFPCNRAVMDDALGVIVHSAYSRSLATHWYGKDTGHDWAVIPLLRIPAHPIDRKRARQALGLPDDAMLVCSFGHLGPSKLNDVLLQAWRASALVRDPRCHLVFVGENHDGDYGAQLNEAIRTNGLADRVRITGWVDTEDYRRYLAAADLAVQLRTMSRGETSAAVLDCMNYGIATVVNANGSMADLPQDSVWTLPDAFEVPELIGALEALWVDASHRARLGERARSHILSMHGPRVCAEQYHRAIEGAYARAAASTQGAIAQIGRLCPPPSDADLRAVALCLSQNQYSPGPRQLLVDVSELVVRDVKSGIQRVVRSLLLEMLHAPPAGFRVEPVYATAGHEGYRYARHWTMAFLGAPPDGFVDDGVEARQGDVFLALDLNHEIPRAQAPMYRQWRDLGVRTYFVVYDLLPVRMPQYFPPGAAQAHADWLDVVAQADGALCISRAVANDLQAWLGEHPANRVKPVHVAWFHLGCDLENSAPTTDLPDDAEALLAQFSIQPTFLMVGTIEPRKGHAQTLAAFERLWAQGTDANLVLVGKQGWMVEDLVRRLQTHAEAQRHLFWFPDASDAFLERIYAASTCLVAASEGEGFGLPLIEAARHGLPIIARDIAVFREVAGDHAFYFSGLDADSLADALQVWLDLHANGLAPRSDAARAVTWKQSADEVIRVLFDERPGPAAPLSQVSGEHAQPPRACERSKQRGPAP